MCDKLINLKVPKRPKNLTHSASKRQIFFIQLIVTRIFHIISTVIMRKLYANFYLAYQNTNEGKTGER